MEYSHAVGVGAVDEKWSGSTGESGWTMYIGSPIHGSDRTKGNTSLEHHHHHDNEEDEEEEEESDDSMASDASSGPISPHEIRSRAANRLRYADKEHSKKKKKKRDEITREKNEEQILLHKADSAASQV